MMQRVWMPREWFEMVDKWKPEVDFSILARWNIPQLLEGSGKRIVCCEWRPSVYGLSAVVASMAESVGLRTTAFGGVVINEISN